MIVRFDAANLLALDKRLEPALSLVGFFDSDANLGCELRITPRTTGGAIIHGGGVGRIMELPSDLLRPRISRQAIAEFDDVDRELLRAVAKPSGFVMPRRSA